MLCRKSAVKRRRGSVAVHLNVYDLTSINDYAYWLGLGVYHSGVQGLHFVLKKNPFFFQELQFWRNPISVLDHSWPNKHESDLNIHYFELGFKFLCFLIWFPCFLLNSAVHGVEYAFGAHEYPTTGIFEGEPRICEGFRFRKSILIGWTEMSDGEVRVVMENLGEKYRGNAYNLITKNCNHFCNEACIKLSGNSIPNWINRLARIGNPSFLNHVFFMFIFFFFFLIFL